MHDFVARFVSKLGVALAHVVVAFSLDTVAIIAGYAHHDIDNLALYGHYGSCFDCTGSGLTYFASKSKRSVEMQPGGPYCDGCLKKWISEGRLVNLRSSPICSECKQLAKWYEDKRKAMHIDLRPYDDYPSTPTTPVYTNWHEVHGIEAKDLEVYREHARNNAECGLPTKLWLCSDCFKNKSKPPIIDVACDMCKTLFQRFYTSTAHTKHCCWSIGLDDCYNADRTASKWQGSLKISDSITMGEARKVCRRAVCDESIGKLVEQGKLTYLPRGNGVDPRFGELYQ